MGAIAGCIFEDEGICEQCGNGSSGSGTTECTHNYEIENDETNHWEVCSKCDEVKENSTTAHTYENGVCVCGAKESTPNTPCEHEYGSDNKNHWKVCSLCREIKSGSIVAHTYGEYVDNKDGTHSATCTACKYELTEDHKKDEDCSLCGYTGNKPDDKTPGDKKPGEGNKVDNTVVDKEIPHTGAGKVALIAIFVIGIAGAISAVKMKKYKGI